MAKTKHPTTILKQWMRDATPEQQQALADIATSGSRNGLYQIAGQHRQTRPGKAALIERATQTMHKETKGVLPVVYRTDLAAECAQCEYAQKCLGPIALRAGFPVADDQ